MPTTYPDISLSLNLARFHVPTAEATYSFTDENGLHLDTGGDVNYALASVPVAQGLAPALVGAIEFLKPQTLTLAYATVHLVAGMTVDINYNFASADNAYKDFAFAVLEDNSGSAVPALLYDSKQFSQSLRGLTGYDQLYAAFQGHHGGEHFTVDHTGDYTLVTGVADVGDKTGTTELALTDVSIGLPASAYTVVPGLGLKLSDNTLLTLTGLELPPAGSSFTDVATSLLAPAGQELVTALAVQALTTQIGQAAVNAAVGRGGVLATQAGGTVNPLAGGQASTTRLTTFPGAGQVAVNNSALLSENGAGLVSAADASLITQDGGGLITQDGGGLITQDGGGLITQDGGGLITQDGGGLITQDGGGVVSNDGGSLAASGATGLFTPNGSGGGRGPGVRLGPGDGQRVRHPPGHAVLHPDRRPRLRPCRAACGRDGGGAQPRRDGQRQRPDAGIGRAVQRQVCHGLVGQLRLHGQQRHRLQQRRPRDTRAGVQRGRDASPGPS